MSTPRNLLCASLLVSTFAVAVACGDSDNNQVVAPVAELAPTAAAITWNKRAVALVVARDSPPPTGRRR